MLDGEVHRSTPLFSSSSSSSVSRDDEEEEEDALDEFQWLSSTPKCSNQQHSCSSNHLSFSSIISKWVQSIKLYSTSCFCTPRSLKDGYYTNATRVLYKIQSSITEKRNNKHKTCRETWWCFEDFLLSQSTCVVHKKSSSGENSGECYRPNSQSSDSSLVHITTWWPLLLVVDRTVKPQTSLCQQPIMTYMSKC